VKNRAVSISLAVALILSVALVGCAGEGMSGIAEYTLTVSSTEGGEVTAPGEGTFAYSGEAVVGLVARPASGYRFVNWSGDVYGITNVNAASTIITMNDNYSLIANFEAAVSARYSLTLSSTEGGSVTTPGEGTFSYDGGRVVSLVATPDPGYQFVNWTGNVQTIADISAASITITMDDNCSVVANFEPIPLGQYTLTISSMVGGSVSAPGQGTFTYDPGTVVDMVVEFEEGYKFYQWTGDIETIEVTSSVDGTTSTRHCQPPMHFSITMDGNYAITVHFIPRWFIPTG
jgi:hypothetical protein